MLSALQNIAGTLLSALQTRLSLLGNELQVQKIMLTQLLGLWLGFLFCLALAILLTLGLLLSVFWEYRIVLLGLFAVLFFLLTVWCYACVLSLIHKGESMFVASLAALHDDLSQLRAVVGQKEAANALKQRGKVSE